MKQGWTGGGGGPSAGGTAATAFYLFICVCALHSSSFICHLHLVYHLLRGSLKKAG